MDEQTIRIIEAFAKMGAGTDPNEILLAQKKVRTPQGVQKYDQPIGTIITKDMIEKAAKKATEAATKSLHSDLKGGSSTKSSSHNVSSPSVPKTSKLAQPKLAPIAGVPGGQTKKDINTFYVSSFVNNPSLATMGWVQKKDGKWYTQTYENGVIKTEVPATPGQVSALQAMEAKGLVHSGHVPDAAPEAPEVTTVNKLSEALQSGKTTDSPEVKNLINKLQGASSSSDASSKPEADKPATSGKTVEINGKQVKVGRYSRPKGFAKAFLIVHEDGNIEYEDKTGKRKKITAKSFESHQSLGMNKFLTEDTGPLKKDEHFENGKLVKDQTSDQAAKPATVEPVKTTTPPAKAAPQAEKPAQVTLPGENLKPVYNVKHENPEPLKKDLITEDAKSKTELQGSSTKSESGTVKIGNITVKPGRYSRPKGFAKAFLIVHKDGTAEYENKAGERKKLGPKSFEGHWKLGMNKFLTSDTGPMKSGDKYENGKLVEDKNAPSSTVVQEENKPDTSTAVEAAKKASTELKAKQEAAQKAKDEEDAKAAEKAKQDATPEPEKLGTEYALIHSSKIGPLPEGSKLYHVSNQTSDSADIKYLQHADGTWSSINSSGIKKFESEWASEKLSENLKEGLLIPDLGKKSPDTVKVTLEGFTTGEVSHDVPNGSKFYVPFGTKDSAKKSIVYAEFPDGTWNSVSAKSGVKPLNADTTQTLKDYISQGAYAEWTKGPDSIELPAKTDTKLMKVALSDKPDAKSMEVPEGSTVYVPSGYQNSDYVGVATIVEPDGTMWKLGNSSGVTAVTGFEKDTKLKYIANSQLVKWGKYHTAQEQHTSFYVNVKGTKFGPYSDKIKVYHAASFTSDEAPTKYFKDDGKWYYTNGEGVVQASSVISSNIENSIASKALVEDTLEAKTNVIPNFGVSDAEKKSETLATADTSAPKSVKIAGMDVKPGKYSIGKSFAKAFLVVHEDGSTSYVNKEGKSKKLTPAAFKKNWDAGMNKYAGPVETASAPSVDAKPTNTGGPKPGKYYVHPFGVPGNFVQEDSSAEVLDDGSMLFPGAPGQDKTPISADAVISTFTSGWITDQYGNTVSLPNGGVPKGFHLFGGDKAVTIPDLQSLRDYMASGGVSIFSKLKSVAGSASADFLADYAGKYFPNTDDSIRKSIIKAIDDMLQSVTTKQTDKPSVAAVPDQVKAMFKEGEHGYFVMPSTEGYDLSNVGWWESSEQTKFINKVSAEIGDGKVIGQSPSKMSTYGKAAWIQSFAQGDFKKIYELEVSSGMKTNPDTHPGSPKNKDTNAIKWMPAVAGELPAGTLPEGEWSYSANEMTPQEIDNYLIAANMAYPEYLTSSKKKYWVSYHVTGNKIGVDKLSLEAKKKHDTNPNGIYSSKLVFTPDVKPKKAYTDYYESGSQADYWSSEAVDQFIKDFPDAIPDNKKGSPNWQLTSYIDGYVATKKAEEAAKANAEYLESLKPKFQKASGQSVSGGHHEAMVLVDQFGKKWVYKPRDENNIFLADVEQAAHDLARIWGFKTSRSFITEFDDRKGHVQEMFDAEKDMSGVSVSSLTPSQVIDVAKEHLLDWALDNDDSWGANLLVLKNGSIVGIDKGRAYAAIGHWNGLSGDSSAHVHMPLVYTDLYQAIGNKTISQETANAAYFAVIKQARKMQALSDDRMTGFLESAFANRTNWATTGGPANKEEAIKAALDRKNSLVADMESLWSKVFKKAGYDVPEAPKGIVTNQDDQDIHLGMTTAALEQAKANGSYGASAFFAGPDIEDSHAILYHAKSKSGRDMLYAEMKIRESSKAFKDVESWLKDKAVNVDNAYGYTPTASKPTLPNEDDYYQKIIAGVKTISAHALDGKYNEGSLNGMSWVKNTLKNYVDSYDEDMKSITKSGDLIKQYKDPKAFLDMANKYLDYIAKAEQHKANGTKSMPGEFTQYVWTPPKKEEPLPTSGVGVKVELRSASSAKASINGVPTFEPDGSLKHSYGYTHDGNPGSMYLVTLPTGETIEFRGNTTGTPATSKGLTRFTLAAGADESASLERIRAQMAEMGLEMKDAEEEDLELYYWRHLAGIMNERADSKDNNYVHNLSTDKFNKFKADKPVETSKMTPTEELEAWKKAFAHLTSRDQVDQFVAEGGHLPKFGHYHLSDTTKYSGQPYWERFDVDDSHALTKKLPSGSFYTDEAAEYVVTTGGMLSTEARLRTLGMWKDGMSSSSDQSHGSSGFVFIRQNLEVTPSTASYGLMGVYYNPKILKRTHNYSFADDQFGEMKNKPSNSYFDFDELTKHNGSGNELMVKHAVSLLDDIEIITFTDPVLRKKMIKYLKDLGIDEIRGVPVEKRFVMRNKEDIIAAQKAIKEAWKK